MRVRVHRRIVRWPSWLIQGYRNLLSTLFIALISCTSFLHVRWCIARNVCVVRESASKLWLVAIVLGSASVLILLGLRLPVRLLIIQNLNILIIIIIISFLALHLETSDRYALHSTIVTSITSYWSRCSINIVRSIIALTRSQVACRTQGRWLVMHQSLLICNVNRIHLHVWIIVHTA